MRPERSWATEALGSRGQGRSAPVPSIVREVKWVVESERMIECLGRHDSWARHPEQLREVVPPRAEALAERKGKGTVYQQHVLRAAADVAEEINNEI